MQQAQLWQVLQEKAPDRGLWNGRKVADWLSEVTGTNYCTFAPALKGERN